MTWTTVKRDLNGLKKEELISLIATLYKKNKVVKEHLELLTTSEEVKQAKIEVLFEQYQVKIHEGFFPKRGHQLKLSQARKALNEFNKLVYNPYYLIKIKLVYIRSGAEFVACYGDITESFYTSAIKLFEEVLAMAKKENLFAQFQDEFKEVVKMSDHFGYGYGDDMSYCFDEVYPD